MASTRGLQPEGGRQPNLEWSSGAAGVVILGPTLAPIAGLAELCAMPGITPIMASSQALSSWKAASGEVLKLARRASIAVRDQQTALLYLDSHVDPTAELDPELHEFVCARLGQIMMGLADQPVYLALYGQSLARAIVVECLGDTAVPVLGAIAEGAEVWELTIRTMFPGLPVAVCPDGEDVAVLGDAIEWFESQRPAD